MKFFNRLTWLQWLLLGAFFLILLGTIGLGWGYASGIKARQQNLSRSLLVDVGVQFELGLRDFEAGNYDLAHQRFEYVFEQHPDFPGAVDMLAATRQKLDEPEATFAIDQPSPTPSPTPDARPVESLYTQAEDQFQAKDWQNLVQTIVALRNIDPLYRAAEVDRMLYLGLRFSGSEKILNDGNLEGGVYDLALSTRFAPLDYQARIYQEWARLYQIGVSFWGVFPDRAVYYFGQLAAAAPYLRDFSGLYAKDRYRSALLQYGNQLSESAEWCLAQEQYQLANSLLEDAALAPTLTAVDDLCLHGGETPTPTETSSELILTPTPSPTSLLSLTPTLPIEVTVTPTSTETASEPSPTPEPAVETPTPAPTETGP